MIVRSRAISGWTSCRLTQNRTAMASTVPLIAGPGLSGYALNAGVINTKSPDPTRIPFIYDSINLARNASDLATSLPLPGRHKGRNNVAYLDAHAKSVPNGVQP